MISGAFFIYTEPVWHFIIKHP